MHLLPRVIRTLTFLEAILSTLKAFTSTLQTAFFCYYYVQAGKKSFLLNCNFFDKEAFQLGFAYS